MPDPCDRPPLKIGELLRLLHRREIDWVLSGSTVLVLYGADLEPNDLDLVPATDPANLQRLAEVLVELEAAPGYEPGWSKSATLAECRAWTPEPATPGQLDHLFVTTLGQLDVVPELTGTYDELRAGATLMVLAGTPVWVCDPDAVLGRLPERPRPKDRARSQQYAAVREALRLSRRPRGLGRFNAWAGPQGL
ncbi:hypothetical protein [Microlunatus sp. GCM10028923]|uniref:hypothetical protein n=1 Tax=Microlunatus sp. GCM10028923 TaxID=3273400 RepID=UPI00361C7FA6